ncbi:MAG: PIN domain-containing protein, partial [Pseudomonadota bacterium]|nr:PIN domain-containing protein [Pseudomonadota bacterium]
MSYLLDTHVLANAVAETPHPGVEAWLQGSALELLHVSVITLGEMRYGVERLPASARRRRFAAHLRSLAD